MDSTTPTTDQHTSAKGARILFVTTVPITLTSFLIPFAEHLKAQGALVDCASMGASTYGGLETFNNRLDISWDRSLSSMLRYSACRKQLEKILDEGKYDIVHVHTPIAAFMTRKACAQWKARHSSKKPAVIYTVHGFHFFEGQTSRLSHTLFHALEKRALSWTDALVVMNNEDEIAAHNLQPSSPSTHIERIDGIGFDFARYENARLKRAQQTQDAPSQKIENRRVTHLCIIAEHNDNKDLTLLFNALALLKNRGVTNFHLTVVGSGPLTDNLKMLASQLKIDGLLTFTGQLGRIELDEVIENTDIGVLVSKREGLPRSLMEFCAAGATIAGTATRGIVDEVRDTRALAEKRTPECVGDMLQNLIEHPTLQREIAHAQYQYAKAHFDLPLIVEAYDRLYAHYLLD